MSDSEGLATDVPKIVEALARVFLEEGKRDLGLMLTEATMRVRQTSYDNWDGGTYGYTLELQVPARRFAALGETVETLEADLKARIERFARLYPNEHVETVVIAPTFSAEGASAPVEETSAPAFWPNGFFRLFLSHVSALRAETAELAESLSGYGIAGFVAHDAIEPTKPWEEEIRLALTTCDALAALLSAGFNESKWTDQEVGFAIGRGILVIPVRLGLDPYGFIARYQGYQGRGSAPADIAQGLVAILLKHDMTRTKMGTALISAFEQSKSFAAAKSNAENLNLIQEWTPELIERAKRTATENYQVTNAFGVPDKVERIVGRAKRRLTPA